MAYDRFLVGPMKAGQQTNLKPYAIMDDAFESMRNAYVWRGRIRKRFGARVINPSADQPQLNTRLGYNVGSTNGSGDFGPTALTDLRGTGVSPNDMQPGILITVGSEIYTVTALGNPATIITTAGGTVTFNTTGANPTLQVAGAVASTDIFLYLTEPVMGFITFENPAINREQVTAFDTRFAYQLTTGANYRWQRIGTGANALWSGTDGQFFGGTNYRGLEAYTSVLYVTNFNEDDGMRYWDGATWNAFRPVYVQIAGPTDLHLETARILIPFKNRLIALNTIEEVSSGVTQNFQQRARWSQNVNRALDAGPLRADSWREDEFRGGFQDASTSEQIVVAKILKDRLIVEFERSTWELVYTQNATQPFQWQKINSELGVESTFSLVPFDKVLLGIGHVGVHACNGANVERIDEMIPEEVFNIHNENDGPQRVHGIRDYTSEMVYWTFPNFSENQETIKFPQQILVYNYQTGSWSFNDDSITAFGYYQQEADLTWDEVTWTWDQWTSSWDEGSAQADYRDVVAGNQQGFTFVIDSQRETRNSLSLSITEIGIVGGGPFTVYRHNLQSGEFVYVSNIVGSAEYTALNNAIYEVIVLDTDTISLVGVGPFSGGSTYEGRGTLERVSRINILSKQYNFYAKYGDNIAFYKMDVMVDRTSSGAITVDYQASSNSQSLVEAGFVSGAALGTNNLSTAAYPSIPFEANQDRLWHPVYFQGEGEVVQIRFYHTESQMTDQSIVFQDFQLHQFVCYTNRVGRLQ